LPEIGTVVVGLGNAAQPPAGGWATEIRRFGSEGIGPGHFADARAIAVDNGGRVYVGDYGSGRIQVFEEDGTYRTQWMLPKDAYVDSFAVTRDRILYAPVHTELHAYVADTGHLLNAQAADEDSWLQAAGIGAVLPGWFQDSIALAPDGGLVTVIDESIVRFNATGDPVLTIPDAIESASGETELSLAVAIDGLENIYALAGMQGVVYKFDADGRYLDRFGGTPEPGGDSGPGVLSSASALAVDSQGRVYVNDMDGIEVFDSEGRPLALIDVPGYPFGLAFNDAGELFVANRTQVLVYRIDGQP
jgi:DNA-binding beta-propeller fold protein YncE